MRNIVNISLPPQLKLEVTRAVKNGNYASTSEFFRDLLRSWAEEEKVLKGLQKSRSEISSGKGKILKSLKALR